MPVSRLQNALVILFHSVLRSHSFSVVQMLHVINVRQIFLQMKSDM